MRRFFVVLYAVTALVHLPMVVVLQRLLIRLPVGGQLGQAWSWGLSGVAALGLAVAFHGRVALARWDRPIGRLRRLVLEEPYYAHWVALFLAPPLFLVVGAVSWLAGTAAWPGWSALADRWLFAYALSGIVGVWAVMVRRRLFRVREIEVPLAGLDAAFDGYRVAQLSDLHVGSMTPERWARRWVARVAELEVDLVVLTGDYLTSGVRFHRQVADSLAALRARDGVYAVMGNHDYFDDGEPLMSLLAERGVVVLRNEHVEIERDGGRICLAGVDDVYTRRDDVAAALAGRDESVVLIVLAHDPVSFPAIAARGADLVLSGHTHWGQVAMPFFAERFGYRAGSWPYRAGRHRLGDSQLYVHPGLGTTGPPLRVGTCPEITVLALRALDG